MNRLESVKWAGTAVQIVGVAILSGRMAAPTVAFAVMLVGSLALAGAALATRDRSLLALNLAFTASNLVGIARWFA